MSHSEKDDFWNLCKENFFFCFLMIIMMGFLFVPFGMSIVFDFRYSKEFARERLEEVGFEEVEVLKKYSIGIHLSPFPMTTENWFDFRAIKGDKSIKGRLVCMRQWMDWERSRCVVNPPFD